MTLDRISVIVNSFIEMNDAEAFLVDKNQRRDPCKPGFSSYFPDTRGRRTECIFTAVEKKVSGKSYDFCTLDGNMTVFKEVDGTNWLLVSYVPTQCCTCGSGRIAESYDHFQHYLDPCIVCSDRTCDACGDSSGEGDDKGNYQHGIR